MDYMMKDASVGLDVCMLKNQLRWKRKRLVYGGDNDTRTPSLYRRRYTSFTRS
jgi:hypothetical protein